MAKRAISSKAHQTKYDPAAAAAAEAALTEHPLPSGPGRDLGEAADQLMAEIGGETTPPRTEPRRKYTVAVCTGTDLQSAGAEMLLLAGMVLQALIDGRSVDRFFLASARKRIEKALLAIRVYEANDDDPQRGYDAALAALAETEGR